MRTLGNALGIPEPKPRLPARVCRRHTGIFEFRRKMLDMGTDLFFHFAMEVPATD
jgi:hypothetical protein